MKVKLKVKSSVLTDSGSDKAETYNDLFKALRKSGESASWARNAVRGYAEQDIYHYGKKKWFKESGQLAASKKWVSKKYFASFAGK